jgi:hypothetical protein
MGLDTKGARITESNGHPSLLIGTLSIHDRVLNRVPVPPNRYRQGNVLIDTCPNRPREFQGYYLACLASNECKDDVVTRPYLLLASSYIDVLEVEKYSPRFVISRHGCVWTYGRDEEIIE